ncbi:hypothetical protein BDF19DRAFT_433388 [Syncephalis fuscata]|nr:hypothetical protein BDF19DRAFT_433388 [Syncephalis fuscata]
MAITHLLRQWRDVFEDEILRRLRPRVLLAWMALVLVMLVFAFVPLHMPVWGRVAHCVGFTLVTMVSFFLWDGPQFFNALGVGICMVFLSISIEVVRGWLPGRYLNWEDISANIVGTAFGWIMAWFIDNSYRKRKAKQQADYIMLAHERDWIGGDDDDDDDDRTVNINGVRWDQQNSAAKRRGDELV